MAFNKLWNALTGKNNDETPPETESKNDIIPLASEAFPVVKISERQLSSYKQIPLASLASLGSVFSKLPEGAGYFGNLGNLQKIDSVHNISYAMNGY